MRCWWRRRAPARARWCRWRCWVSPGHAGRRSCCSSRADWPPGPWRRAWRRRWASGSARPWATACGWTRASGPRTRLEVVTEGILTRMLQQDAALEGVAAVLFDEFHERSLHADLGLALCREAQESLGLPLRLLVMSATIDAAAVATRLGDAPVIEAQGRMFPVAMHYLGQGIAGAAGAAHAARRAKSSRWPRRCGACWMKPMAMCWCSCPARRRSTACAKLLEICAHRGTRYCARCTASWISTPSSRCCSPARAGPPQGDPRHQHRRDQPHHRRRARGDRYGARAPLAV